jgi:hypothetical protein
MDLIAAPNATLAADFLVGMRWRFAGEKLRVCGVFLHRL